MSERRVGWGLRTVVALTALVLLAPTLVVIPMSFTGADSFGFPPESWSLRWYRSFFGSEKWMLSLLTSVQIAFLVAIVATVLGVAVALGLSRSRFAGKSADRKSVV